MHIHKFSALCFLIASSIFSCFAYADDWSDCSDSLASIQKAAGDASDASESAAEAQQTFEEASSDLQNCLALSSDPDDCDTQQQAYEDAKSDYQSARDDAESAINQLNYVLKMAAGSCPN